MRSRTNRALALGALSFLLSTVHAAEQPAAPAPLAIEHPPAVVRLTLEEAKQSALSSNKTLALASMNIESKEYATRATRADYFPKLIGSSVYFHFDSPLGTVLTRRGLPRLGVASATRDVNVINKNATLTTVGVGQPITALLKIRQGVKIAKADEQIAQAQQHKAVIAISSGVEQLFWGLLASARIQAGAKLAVEGAEALAKMGTLEARLALVEARQGLQAADAQVADVEEQLKTLLDLPLCTKLELVEPALPGIPVRCVDDAISMALASSPEVTEAEQTIVKARAAVKAAKVDYLPNVNLVGGFGNQSFADYIQPDFGYVGLQASVTFFEWGKRKNTVRERNMGVSMAETKLEQTRQEVRAKVQKAFREVDQTSAALRNATDMLALRKEAMKKAVAPADALPAAKAQGLAEVEFVKAELSYRVAIAELASLIGKP